MVLLREHGKPAPHAWLRHTVREHEPQAEKAMWEREEVSPLSPTRRLHAEQNNRDGKGLRKHTPCPADPLAQLNGAAPAWERQGSILGNETAGLTFPFHSHKRFDLRYKPEIKYSPGDFAPFSGFASFLPSFSVVQLV